MSDTTFWTWHKGSWIEVFKQQGRFGNAYTAVDGRIPFRDEYLAEYNVWESKPDWEPFTGLTVSLNIRTRKIIDISLSLDNERTLLKDTEIDSDDLSEIYDKIRYHERGVFLKVIEEVVELSGWDGTHICSSCEGSSVSSYNQSEEQLSRTLCSCGSIGQFIPIDDFLKENKASRPFVGQTVSFSIGKGR